MFTTAPSDLILISEAARLLGVSAQSLRQWSDAGRVPVTKTAAGFRLFSRADVLRLRQSLDERRALTPSPA